MTNCLSKLKNVHTSFFPPRHWRNCKRVTKRTTHVEEVDSQLTVIIEFALDIPCITVTGTDSNWAKRAVISFSSGCCSKICDVFHVKMGIPLRYSFDELYQILQAGTFQLLSGMQIRRRTTKPDLVGLAIHAPIATIFRNEAMM